MEYSGQYGPIMLFFFQFHDMSMISMTTWKSEKKTGKSIELWISTGYTMLHCRFPDFPLRCFFWDMGNGLYPMFRRHLIYHPISREKTNEILIMFRTSVTYRGNINQFCVLILDEMSGKGIKLPWIFSMEISHQDAHPFI